MMGKLTDPTRDMRHEWHVAINQYVWPRDGRPRKEHDETKWMYEAKEMHAEVPRLKLLFSMERQGQLPTVHQQCSHASPEPVPENHLTCCLGVKCHECPELQAIEAMQGTPEQIDEAKAWTCAVHIVSRGGDWAREGYLLTVDDRMYWDRLYANLSQPNPDGADDDEA